MHCFVAGNRHKIREWIVHIYLPFIIFEYYKSDLNIFLIVNTENSIPINPKTIAATGMDKSPAALPCELEIKAIRIIEDTIVAIDDFPIMPILKGNNPIQIVAIIIIICVSGLSKLNATYSKRLLRKNILTF